MDTNLKNNEYESKYESKYENCWIKHLVVLDKCMDGTPSVDKIEVCYQIFKKNFQQCVGVNAVTNPLYFNKIVK